MASTEVEEEEVEEEEGGGANSVREETLKQTHPPISSMYVFFTNACVGGWFVLYTQHTVT